jgi:hypothetical protein
MTRIVKVYKTHQKARQMLDYFCEINQPHEVKFKDMKVNLLTGDTIYFRYVKDLEDVMRQFCGSDFQWVEFDPDVHWELEIVQWMQSRIRTPNSQIKE